MSNTTMEEVFKAGFIAGRYNSDDYSGGAEEAWEVYRYDVLLRASGKEVADEWLAARHKPQVVIENLKCPDCGGEMVPRSGPYGKFWGCKNYPKCKGTRDSEGLSKAERQNQKDIAKEDKDLNGLSDLEDVPVESGELYKFKKS